MKASIYGALLTAAACFSATSLFENTAAAASATTQHQVKAFQAYLREFRKAKGIPSLSVAVIKNGEIILLESIGFQDHDADASAKALAEYSIALDDNRIMPESLRERMWTPANDSEGNPMPYAYGWYVQNWQGHRLVWHSGWWPDAYAGLLLKAPDDDLTLVALSNGDGLRHDIDTLTRAQIQGNPLALKFLQVFVGVR